MSDRSPIQWTDATWNPVRGCSRVSAGCMNCYAERQAIRQISGAYNGLVKRTSHGPAWTGEVGIVSELLDLPLRWRKSRRVFVNSMSDLFHEGVPDEFIERVFSVMAGANRHTFQVLTKRPHRMREFVNRFSPDGDGFVTRFAEKAMGRYDGPVFADNAWPLPNVWLGVSVEDQATADERIPLLLQTPAAVRFVSYEPALSPVDFRFTNGLVHGCDAADYTVDWLIVGGESGPGARPCRVQWIESAVRQCRDEGIACFVKQLGTYPVWADVETSPVEPGRGKNDNLADWPAALQVRQFPGEAA